MFFFLKMMQVNCGDEEPSTQSSGNNGCGISFYPVFDPYVFERMLSNSDLETMNEKDSEINKIVKEIKEEISAYTNNSHN